MREDLDPNVENLDLHALVQGLARSASWIAGMVAIGTLAGLAYGMVQQNVYVSEGKIEVRLGIRERQTPESSLSPDAIPPTPGIGDELELLHSPEVYKRIAQQIGPERILAPYNPAAGDREEGPLVRWLHAAQSWWFERQAPESLDPEQALVSAAAFVEASIDVRSRGGTSYLTVRSTASAPEMAQLLTGTYVTTARQWHREVYSSKTELTFVTDRLTRYEEESRDAERAFSEHRDGCGFYDIESQKSRIIGGLEELNSRLQEHTIRTFEIEDELAFIGQELEATPTLIEKLIPPSVKVNREYQAALNQLQRLTGERASLVSVYAAGSEIFRRKAEQIDGEIERVEAHLAELPELVEYGSTTREEVANPRHEELAIRLAELQRERKTRTIAAELRQQSKDDLEERLRAALDCDPTHRDLSLAVNRADARVRELTAELERAQAIALLDQQEEMDSLRIAQDGSFPLGKAGPNRERFLILGLAGGLAVGLFLATLRYLMDTRLHDPSALQEALGLELIGVVPETRKARLRVRVRKAARA